MHRCLALAKLGMGRVAPNPMVGAVLVYQNKIIGEGYHQKYGEAHAEVNCIQSVKSSDQEFIAASTLYVSLEPCAHFGKTPPCADLIIKHKIPKVVIGCRDPFAEVNGKGIEKLKAAGIEAMTGVLEKECLELNKCFFTFHAQQRPYIVLKWAQTGDRKIAGLSINPSVGETASTQGRLEPKAIFNNDFTKIGGMPANSLPSGEDRGGPVRLLISNEYANRLVHKWRSEAMAIVVGTNTALYDDPELTTRFWPGTNPVRIVIDLHLRLPKTLKVFNSSTPTIVFNLHQHTLPDKASTINIEQTGVVYYQVTEGVNLIHQLVHALYQTNIQSIMVEGGAKLLQSFIDESLWDEARVVTNEKVVVGSGLPAPILKNEELAGGEQIFSDMLRQYKQKV
jgi:diaminohydroxyphosphoribosylaminopyrimidine deaminase/5-amino-6-(5-phosphoribosylamino)uracil reductase